MTEEEEKHENALMLKADDDIKRKKESEIPFMLHEHHNVAKLFRFYFKTNFAFYDPIISSSTKKVSIDLLKFDDWLHSIHGEYEDKGYSMETFIKEEYGNEACLFFKRLI